MNLQNLPYGLSLAAALTLGSASQAQPVNLNCAYRPNPQAVHLLTFDEDAKTATFDGVGPSQAEFTDTDISWWYWRPDHYYKVFFTLSRTNGGLEEQFIKNGSDGKWNDGDQINDLWFDCTVATKLF